MIIIKTYPDIPRPTMDYTKSYTDSQRGFHEGLTIRKIYNSIGYFFLLEHYCGITRPLACSNCFILNLQLSWKERTSRDLNPREPTRDIQKWHTTAVKIERHKP
jgi:hypothetical protein